MTVSTPPEKPPQDSPRKRGRPRKGQITQYTGGRLGGRVTRDIDGETVRRRVKLATRESDVAHKKLVRLGNNPEAPVTIAHSDETFAEAAERIDKKRSVTIVRGHEELGKLKLHAFPTIGHLAVTAITSDDIETVLDGAQEKGLGHQSVKHLRNAMNAVFKAIKRDKKLSYKLGANPVLASTMPEFKKTTKKVISALEDPELVIYLRWHHPVERFQIAVLQRQVMYALGRVFGGERTGDLHSNCWEDFEIVDGVFVEGWNPRQKTGEPQRFDVPEVFRPILKAYWTQQGKPKTGPLFPVLRGDRTGEARDGGSHADAFRRDLQRAMGIFVWGELPRPAGSKPGRGKPRLGWVQAREMTRRERELFVPTKFTDPVTFHSARRSYGIGLQDAGLSVEDGAVLAGATPGSHVLYRRDRGTAQRAPAGSMPDLTGVAEALFGHLVADNQAEEFMMNSETLMIAETLERARKDSNLRPSASESETRVVKGAKSYAAIIPSEDVDDGKTPSRIEAGLKSWPKIEPALTLSEAALSDLMALVNKAKRWDLAKALSAQLEALAAAQLDTNVASLDAARRKRDGK